MTLRWGFKRICLQLAHKLPAVPTFLYVFFSFIFNVKTLFVAVICITSKNFVSKVQLFGVYCFKLRLWMSANANLANFYLLVKNLVFLVIKKGTLTNYQQICQKINKKGFYTFLMNQRGKEILIFQFLLEKKKYINSSFVVFNKLKNSPTINTEFFSAF